MTRIPSLLKISSKARVDLLSRSRIRNRTGVALLAQCPGEVACVLDWPGDGTSDVHAAAVELDEEEYVEPAKRDCLDREEVDGETPVACARRNSRQDMPPRLPAGPRPWSLARSTQTRAWRATQLDGPMPIEPVECLDGCVVRWKDRVQRCLDGSLGSDQRQALKEAATAEFERRKPNRLAQL